MVPLVALKTSDQHRRLAGALAELAVDTRTLIQPERAHPAGRIFGLAADQERGGGTARFAVTPFVANVEGHRGNEQPASLDFDFPNQLLRHNNVAAQGYCLARRYARNDRPAILDQRLAEKVVELLLQLPAGIEHTA